MTQDELYMQMALAEARQAASDDEVPVAPSWCAAER